MTATLSTQAKQMLLSGMDGTLQKVFFLEDGKNYFRFDEIVISKGKYGIGTMATYRLGGTAIAHIEQAAYFAGPEITLSGFEGKMQVWLA